MMKRATTLAQALAFLLFACTVYHINADEHSVFKRATPTVVGIMNTFQKAQPCCSLPVMLPRANTTCGRVRTGYTVIVSRGIFSSWQSLGAIDGTASENGAAQACFIDCLFNSMDMVENSTRQAVLNVEKINENFAARVNTTWEETVVNATDFCVNKTETLKLTTVRYFGKLCSTLPMKFMVCMRRQLFLACPSPASTFISRI